MKRYGLRDDQFARIKELHQASSPRLRALAASTPARALDALGDASRRLLDAVL